ncbi:MAG: DUF3644 domain-containing protein [Chitinophagales bacterium]
MRKRKSPIAKNLINNSIAGMFSAVEIHNKPTIKYRYEIVVLLILNSWELLLKGYLYKYKKSVKLFLKDGTTKPFESCLNLVSIELGKDFNTIQENLRVLYNYRNQVAHFYIEELDPIIFSLISKNILFYSDFLRKFFKIDISKESDLILLPIGFKRPMSPIDFISTTSFNENSSPEIKAFLQTIMNATQRLNDDKIDETILVDFRMNLININRTTNADLIAGIDNSRQNNLIFTINKEPKKVMLSKEGQKINVTRNRNEAHGTLYYEELQEGIFDEINNVLDANRLISKGNQKFMLGELVYYRIYSERQYVNESIEIFKLLAKTAALDINAPFLFWLTKLPPSIVVDILYDVYNQSKAPKIYNLIKIIFLLGEDAIKIFHTLLKDEFSGITQKPEYYYSFMELMKIKKNNPILKVLKATNNKILFETHTYGSLIKDNNIPLRILSQECLNVFKGNIKQRANTRDLDFLTYGHYLINNEPIITELKSRN